MMDWEGDPKLKQLRDDFVNSFPGRALEISEELKKSTDWRVLEKVAHSLAGIAHTYGFPVLGEISEKLDDLCSSIETPEQVKLYASYFKLLEEALSESYRIKTDPIRFVRDPRLKELTSVVESLLDEAKLGSS